MLRDVRGRVSRLVSACIVMCVLFTRHACVCGGDACVPAVLPPCRPRGDGPRPACPPAAAQSGVIRHACRGGHAGRKTRWTPRASGDRQGNAPAAGARRPASSRLPALPSCAPAAGSSTPARCPWLAVALQPHAAPARGTAARLTAARPLTSPLRRRRESPQRAGAPASRVISRPGRVC